MLNIDEWFIRMRRLKIRMKDFAPMVPVSLSYLSQLCSGTAKNPSTKLYIRIETLLRELEQKAEKEKLDTPDKGL